MLPARQTAPGLGGRMNRVPDLSWLGARCTLCRGRESFILAALILIEMFIDLERKSCAMYRKVHVDAPHGVANRDDICHLALFFCHLLSRQPQQVLSPSSWTKAL